MDKVAIYIRVSTVEQAKEGYSIAAQRDKLISFCKVKNWNINEIYIDDGYTGTNLERPGLQKMLLHLDETDVVLVYKLDRLSRSQKDVLFLVEEKFLKNDVDFVSILESFDTTTPFGRAMLGILAVFAQLERDTIVERTKLGKERRAKEGLWRGGGNVPIGYKFVEDNLIIDDYEAMQVKEIFKLYNEGKGYSKISNILNKKGFKTNNSSDWNSTQVSRVLKNRTYTGYVEYNGEYYPGNHPAIISEDFFNETQKLLNKKIRIRIPSSNYLLGGLLWCGYCGARLKASWSSAGKGGSKYYFYVCYSRAKRPSHMVKDPNCPGQFWQMEKLDSIVVEELKKLPKNKDKLTEEFNQELPKEIPEQNIDILKNQINDINKKISRLMDLYEDDKIPVKVISNRIDSLYKQKKQLEENISQMSVKKKEVIDNDISLDEVLSILDNFEIIWEEATFEEKRIILKDLVKRIIVTDSVEIEWNYGD